MIEVKLSGRYRLEAKIADGAVGTVWRANDEVLDRAVAVKILHPHLAADDRVRGRFRLEALSAAQLTHPNIVAIYDTGEGAGEGERSPFLVMEHLEGGTLREWLDAQLRLPPAQVARIGVEVCAALDHAHANGIVHRDLKPSNILFGESGHAKVSDFGLAAAPPGPEGAHGPQDPAATSSGGPSGDGLLGDIRYRSPEQVDGAEGDARSDLYSLGLVLYEALTGHAPFADSSDLAAALRRQATTPARPQRLRPDIPRGLDDVVVKALQPSPHDRFKDAAEMRRALAALAAAGDGEEEPSSRARAASLPAEPSEPSSFVKTEGRWLLPALLAVLVVGAIVVIAIKPSIVTKIANPFSGGPQPETITIEGSGAYDPPPNGDGGEHDADVSKAFDGNLATRWPTNGYRGPDFGKLKTGLGIWFDAGKPVSLSHINVVSAAGGWHGTIRTSEDGTTWSAPGAPEEAGTEHVFKTSGKHRYWMVWITRLVTTPGIGSDGNPWGVAIDEIQPAGG